MLENVEYKGTSYLDVERVMLAISMLLHLAVCNSRR